MSARKTTAPPISAGIAKLSPTSAKGELLPDERKAVREWLRETASWEISAVYNNPGRATSSNNWHSHRLKEVGEIGFVIGDTSLEGYAVRGLKEQIGRNLLPDGSS